jgi:hypothetical protein
MRIIINLKTDYKSFHEHERTPLAATKLEMVRDIIQAMAQDIKEGKRSGTWTDAKGNVLGNYVVTG